MYETYSSVIYKKLMLSEILQIELYIVSQTAVEEHVRW